MPNYGFRPSYQRGMPQPERFFPPPEEFLPPTPDEVADFVMDDIGDAGNTLFGVLRSVPDHFQKGFSRLQRLVR